MKLAGRTRTSLDIMRGIERAALFSSTRLLKSLNTQLARIVEPWGSAFASVSAWEASLTARMAMHRKHPRRVLTALRFLLTEPKR